MAVSIPLKSGHIVTEKTIIEKVKGQTDCFNPLKVGSYCNLKFLRKIKMFLSFNPLKVGSYCNN